MGNPPRSARSLDVGGDEPELTVRISNDLDDDTRALFQASSISSILILALPSGDRYAAALFFIQLLTLGEQL